VRWDSELGAKQARRPTGKRENVDWTFDARSFAVIACRQAIAEARSDLDGFVALEQIKHPNLKTLPISPRGCSQVDGPERCLNGCAELRRIE
jgi:hypothetical protein